MRVSLIVSCIVHTYTNRFQRHNQMLSRFYVQALATNTCNFASFGNISNLLNWQNDGCIQCARGYAGLHSENRILNNSKFAFQITTTPTARYMDIHSLDQIGGAWLVSGCIYRWELLIQCGRAYISRFVCIYICICTYWNVWNSPSHLFCSVLWYVICDSLPPLHCTCSRFSVNWQGILALFLQYHNVKALRQGQRKNTNTKQWRYLFFS